MFCIETNSISIAYYSLGKGNDGKKDMFKNYILLVQTFLVVRGSLRKAVMKYQNQQHFHPILHKQVSYTLLEINGKAQLLNMILIAFYSDS